MSYYLDTNYVVRFITRDNPVQALEAKKFIEKHKKIRLPTIVLAESVYILEKHYLAGKQDVCEVLTALIKQPGISVPSFAALAFEIYRNENISFYDSLIAAETLINKGRLKSFDKKLIKVLGKYQ